jgi:hypothetical protein
VLLPDELVEVPRAHPGRERCGIGHRAILSLVSA